MRVQRARDERERREERDDTRDRDRDRPAAGNRANGVEVRGRTWDDERDDRNDRDDDNGRDRYHGVTRKKRDVERIASAWTRASARLFAGTTDVLSNLVENLSDTFFDFRDDDDDRGRPRYRSSSRRGGRGRYDNDDDYGSHRRRRRSRYSRFADRGDDAAGDLSTAVRDAARVFTRAAESFSRVYEDRDDTPRGRRRVYADDDDEYADKSERKAEDTDRGDRLTVDAGNKHFAVEAESKTRSERKRTSAGEEGPEDSEE